MGRKTANLLIFVRMAFLWLIIKMSTNLMHYSCTTVQSNVNNYSYIYLIIMYLATIYKNILHFSNHKFTVCKSSPGEVRSTSYLRQLFSVLSSVTKSLEKWNTQFTIQNNVINIY